MSSVCCVALRELRGQGEFHLARTGRATNWTCRRVLCQRGFSATARSAFSAAWARVVLRTSRLLSRSNGVLPAKRDFCAGITSENCSNAAALIPTRRAARNTAAAVPETMLRTHRIDKPQTARRKGRRERCLPLWKQTARDLRAPRRSWRPSRANICEAIELHLADEDPAKRLAR